jgi:GLPGLI family protein
MLIKKFILIYFFILGAFLYSGAQSIIVMYDANCYPSTLYLDNYYYGADSIDKAIMRVDYISSIMVDTTLNTFIEQKSLLEIGRNTSRFCLTAYTSLDSILRTSNNISLFQRNDITYPQSFYEMYFQNYPKKGKLTCTGRVCNTDLKYEEDLPYIKWVISDSTNNILGYMVQMATCRFRGRDFVAWFTPQLPVSSGPWKFAGLPGLILKVEDSKKHYSFTAKGIYQTSCPIVIPKYLYIKTSRKKYIQAVQLNFTERFHAAKLYLKGIILQPNSSSPLTREMTHDFIEKE